MSTSLSRSSQGSPYGGYICDNGFTRPFYREIRAGVVTEKYRDSLGNWINIPTVLPPTMRYDACVYQKHVKTLMGEILTSPNYIVTHNLNLVNAKVDFTVYDVANGNQKIEFDTDNFTANTFRLTNIPPSQVGLVVDIIVTGEG